MLLMPLHVKKLLGSDWSLLLAVAKSSLRTVKYCADNVQEGKCSQVSGHVCLQNHRDEY